MIAAIYARKSTEQHGRSDEEKSVTRQIENAHAFAATQGWSVAEDHIYADDAVSGADVRKLRAKQRLLDVIRSGAAPFQVLIMQKSDRLSRRDGADALVELKSIAKAGVQVWFYATRSPFAFGDFKSNVTSYLEAEFNAEFRRAIAEKTHEAMVRKAHAGHVTGGRIFGYDNVSVAGHTHKEYRINEAQAAVVRRIFELCAGGAGLTRIAKMLNAERAVAPGRNGWAPSSVRDVLHRPLYRGELVYNRTKKRDADGEQRQHARPRSEWLTVQLPHARVVDDAVWMAAHARLSGIRTRLATARGERPILRRDIDSVYLLSGFARCSVCGGALSVISRSHGRRRAFFYGCLANHKKGTRACPNALVLPVQVVDDAVLRALGGDLLRPALVDALIDGVCEAMQPAVAEADVQALRADLQGVERKIANLTAAIENGAAVAPLVSQLEHRQQEREKLLTMIAAAEARRALVIDRRIVEDTIRAEIAQWRAILTSDPNVRDTRQFLREVLEEPVTFTPLPERKAYRFEGAASAERLLGEVGLAPLVASPTGFEPVFWP